MRIPPLRTLAMGLALTWSALQVQAQTAQINVICSVQADWCNMITTVYSKTTGTKVNMVLKGSGEALAQLVAEKENPKVDVWFGNFSFGEFGCAEDFRDKNPIAIVNWIDEKISLPEDEVDDYMTKHHYDSWLIPDKWKGMIAYAENYVEENNL